MKKIKTLQNAVFIIAMVALTSAGCAGKSDLESRPAEIEAERTAEPSSMAGSAGTQETVESQGKSKDSDDDVKWSYNKKSRRLTVSGTGEVSSGVKNHVKEIVIGEGITAISDEAFYLLRDLEKITLPDSLQKIGRRAFWKCYSLKEIIIPGNVKIIGDQCFYRCKSLRKITLGENVEEIGRGAFGDCPAIRKVRVSPENRYFMTKNGGLYQKNGNFACVSATEKRRQIYHSKRSEISYAYLGVCQSAKTDCS